MISPPFTPPLDRLEQMGDPRHLAHWPDRNPDYVAQLVLRPEHVPELIEIARVWAEREEWPEDENDLTVYAPIHAWRALAQLQAAEAVEPLLNMIDPLDDRVDDWHLEEFPDVFALIGSAALGPLTAYLSDTGHRVFSRICAAHGLCKAAQRHPESREQAVASISEELAHYEQADEQLNAFLVSYLMDLKAVEAAELIERGFAAGRIDEWVCGGWDEVKKELGVPGLGLVPDEPPRAASSVPPLGSAWATGLSGPSSHQDQANRLLDRKKRKQERQNRKRNRRR